MAEAVTLNVYEITGDTPTTHVWVEVSPEAIGSPTAGDTIHGLTVETGVTGLDHLIISPEDLGGSDFAIIVEKLVGADGGRTFMPILKTKLGDTAVAGSVISALLYTLDDKLYLDVPIITEP